MRKMKSAVRLTRVQKMPIEDINAKDGFAGDIDLGRPGALLLPLSGGAEVSAEVGFVPLLDLSETSEAFLVSCDLPGICVEDLRVEWRSGRLLIAGERRESKRTAEGTLHFAERRHGAFERAVAIGPAADPDRIRADFKDGVLSVTVGKRSGSLPRKIRISPSN